MRRDRRGLRFAHSSWKPNSDCLPVRGTNKQEALLLEGIAVNLFFLVVSFFLFSVPLGARQVAGQAGEKCVLEGIVVKAATGEPLKKALVRLQKVDRQTEPVMALTNSGGRFMLADIEPGRYRLYVQRNGYLHQRYGQRGPNHPGTILSLVPGQRLRDIVFRLIPHAVITGRVYDEDSEPVPGVRVQTLRYRYLRGKQQLIPSGSDTTNDLGEYRVHGLAPGRYYVSATYETSSMYSAARGHKNLARGAEQASANESYAPTFFPGTNDPSRASPIDIRPGNELRNIDFFLLPTPMVSVRGRVLNSVADQTGQKTRVFLLPRALAFRGSTFGKRSDVRPPNGTFEISGVAPGSYHLVAVSFGLDGQYSARLPVEVGDTDVESIQLVIRSGVELAGLVYSEGARVAARVSVSETRTREQDQLEMNELRVLLEPYEDLPVLVEPSPAQVGRDGIFRIENVPPDRYRVNIAGLPRDYYLKSARVGGQNVLEEGLDLRGGTPWGKLELLVSSAGGRIDGAVLTEKQQPFSGARVVLIPEPHRRDNSGLYRIVSSDQNGQFTMRGIPPGEYKLFAWEEVELGAYQDASFLRSYEEWGEPARLQEGTQLSVQLQLIPAEE